MKNDNSNSSNPEYVADKFNTRQLAFQELMIGTLIYTVMLGFLSDYTQIVYSKSYSTIFLASIVLELLTYLTFKIKGVVVSHTKDTSQALMAFCVWFIMFSSKFVFIAVLDFFFGEYIRVNGFFGILLVVALVTVIHRLAYKIFEYLGK